MQTLSTLVDGADINNVCGLILLMCLAYAHGTHDCGDGSVGNESLKPSGAVDNNAISTSTLALSLNVSLWVLRSANPVTMHVSAPWCREAGRHVGSASDHLVPSNHLPELSPQVLLLTEMGNMMRGPGLRCGACLHRC